MSVAPLYNIPKNEADFAQFGFHNMDLHRRIVQAIEAVHNITLPLYPLDPIPLQDIASWATIHQAMHNDFTKVLGIAGDDFTSLNLEDPAELAAWINMHANEMRQAADMLGLS